MIADTAILLFARTPEADALYKPLFLNKHTANKHFYSGLNCYALSVAAGSGLPVFYFDETRQTGNSFGQKISNALQQVFCNGFKKVIVIGNDCPSLTAIILQNTVDALVDNQVVIGPNKRGGIYLLGLQKEAFVQNMLENFAWQSGNLFNSLVSTFDGCGVPHFILPVLHDINNTADVYLTRYTLSRNHAVALLVHDLLYKRPANSGIPQIQFSEDLYSVDSLHAPPALAS